MDEKSEVIKKFSTYVKYPMVIFTKKDGQVLECNYEASTLIGKNPSIVTMVPDKSLESDDFWGRLEQKNAMIWHRILITVDGAEHYVSGLINCLEIEGEECYLLFFEPRSGLNLGSITLEQMINHTELVAFYLYRNDNDWKVRYVSQNIRQFGYTRQEIYAGKIGHDTIIYEKDIDRVFKEMNEAINGTTNEFSLQFRLVTETREIRLVHGSVHITRRKNGEAEALELILRDITDKQKKISEARYLQKALEKSKSFLMVQNFDGKNRKLLYISSNAVSLSINVDALRQGNRLMEDYIHPKDRESVLDMIYKAIETEEESLIIVFRLVGDDGNVRWMKCDMTMMPLSDTEANVEYLLTDITEQKILEKELQKEKKGLENQMKYILHGKDRDKTQMDGSRILEEQKLSDLVEAFSSVTGLYSTIIDVNLKQITVPQGPPEHMGEFYDMFEKPIYKEVFAQLNESVVPSGKPCILDLNDGNPDSKISGAPIYIGDTHVATWLLYAFSKEDAKKLVQVFRAQWELAERLSLYINDHYMVENEIKQNRVAKVQLKKQKESRKVFVEMLENMHLDTDTVLKRICGGVVTHLNIPEISVIHKDPVNGIYELVYCYHLQEEKALNAEGNWDKLFYTQKKEEIKKKGELILNSEDIPADMAMELARRNINAVMIFPIRMNGGIGGYIVFVENRCNRKWDKHEIEFARCSARLMQEVFAKGAGNGNLLAVNKGLLEAFDLLEECILVTDEKTDEIIYANKTMEEKMGHAVAGDTIHSILHHTDNVYSYGEYKNYRTVSLKKEYEYESFLPIFNCAMKITIVPFFWNDGRKARIYILKNVSE